MTRIDVVIVAHESADSLADCLQSASALRNLGSTIVVDHGSDGSGDIAESLGAMVLRDTRNPGFGTGQNRGRSLSNAPYVLLLNPDAIIDADAVTNGAEYLDAHLDVAAVEGVVLDPDTGQPERSAGVEISPIHLWGRALGLRALLRYDVARVLSRRVPALADHVDRANTSVRDVEALSATALLVRKEALESVSGFDERFFMYGEDIDLSRRLRSVGWRLSTLPGAWAWHKWGSSSGGVDRELLWWKGTMTFAARWFDPVGWLVAYLACLVRAVGLVVRYPLHSRSIVRSMFVETYSTRRLMRSGAADDE